MAEHHVRKSADASLHAGHRDRLRQRFFAEGLAHFSEHQMLELLLFYSIPRRDTNELAHRLIECFGSLPDVFDASVQELTDVAGISENSAALLKLIPALCAASRRAQNFPQARRFVSGRDCAPYLCALLCEEKREVVYALYYSASGTLLDAEKILNGNIGDCRAQIQELLTGALRREARGVLLAHNHPGRSPEPSGEDVEITIWIRERLRELHMELLEHVVVSGDAYRCILSEQL